MAHMRMESGIYGRETPAPVAAAPYWSTPCQSDVSNAFVAFYWMSNSPHRKHRPADPTLTILPYCAASMAPLIMGKVLRNLCQTNPDCCA